MKKALEGVKIIEFSNAWAGPYSLTLLGYLGAEVLRVETAKWPDLSRYIEFRDNSPRIPAMDQSVVFNHLNLNKKTMLLDVTHPKGVETALKLVSHFDVVLENMRPGSFKKRGLGYEQVKEVKPDIIYVSSSACGQFGPLKDWAGYAPNFASLAGLCGMTGFIDESPSNFLGSVDLKSSQMLAIAILMALVFRQRTGKGQYIDNSSTEGIAFFLGDQMIKYQLTGKVPHRNGNKCDYMAPHDCFPCKEPDSWISIAVLTEDEWVALCEVMEKPELAQDERFENVKKRMENSEILNSIISEWSRNLTPYEAMEKLQKVGVAAAPPMSSEDLFKDPHTQERGVFAQVEHPKIGKDWVVMPPFRLSETPASIRTHGPLFNEHTDEIARNLLGMTDEEIKSWRADKLFY